MLSPLDLGFPYQDRVGPLTPGFWNGMKFCIEEKGGDKEDS